MQDNRKIAIYSRKSKFTGKGESMENQIEYCKKRIGADLHDIDEEILIYEDEGCSGKNLERPAFQQMMKVVRANKIRTIVSYKLDRISRNLADFANLWDELKELNVEYISASEKFDTSTPTGEAMLMIVTVFAQLERRTIAERIRDNMYELAKTGRWLGGTTPTGYTSENIKRVTMDEKVRTSCKLKPIPDEVKIVRMVFEQFLETGSLTKTETYMLQRHYKTKNDKDYKREAIRNILKNPVYMVADQDAYQFLCHNNADLFSEENDFDGIHGIMAYNRTLQTQGKAHRERPISEWIVSVGKHEGIISGAEWVKVQKLLEENKTKSYRNHAARTNEALLSGLLRCGNCGDYMRPKLTDRKTPDGERIFTYMCSMKEHSRRSRCDIKNINGNTLDKVVLDAVKNLSENNIEFISRLEAGKKILVGDCSGREEELKNLKSEKAQIEKELAKATKKLMATEGERAERQVIKIINDLDEQSETIDKQLKELEELMADRQNTENQFDVLSDMLSSFRDTLDNMTVEEKRVAIRMVVKRVVWDGEKIHIYLFGDEDDDGMDFPPPDDPIWDGEDDDVPSCENSK